MKKIRIENYSYKSPVNSAPQFENNSISEIFNFYQILEYLDFEELILYERENEEKEYCYTMEKESDNDLLNCRLMSLIAENTLLHIAGIYLLLLILLAKRLFRRYWKV
jgi:hypothetical protein